uniref:Uncharacterized protein n=1 Tax=Nelumbo nucifera TaxID=4432 RepID=A0A822ZXB7_NELNU|nr:TPA_asm: hypothetical protein HUJ06_019087 [Nelumbo nucifera]
MKNHIGYKRLCNTCTEAVSHLFLHCNFSEKVADLGETVRGLFAVFWIIWTEKKRKKKQLSDI